MRILLAHILGEIRSHPWQDEQTTRVNPRWYSAQLFPKNQMKGHVYLKQKKQMFVAKPCIINPCFSKNSRSSSDKEGGEIFHFLFINSRSNSVKEGEKYFTTELGSWGLERNTFCLCLQQRSPAEEWSVLLPREGIYQQQLCWSH